MNVLNKIVFFYF